MLVAVWRILCKFFRLVKTSWPFRLLFNYFSKRRSDSDAVDPDEESSLLHTSPRTQEEQENPENVQDVESGPYSYDGSVASPTFNEDTRVPILSQETMSQDTNKELGESANRSDASENEKDTSLLSNNAQSPSQTQLDTDLQEEPAQHVPQTVSTSTTISASPYDQDTPQQCENQEESEEIRPSPYLPVMEEASSSQAASSVSPRSTIWSTPMKQPKTAATTATPSSTRVVPPSSPFMCTPDTSESPEKADDYGNTPVAPIAVRALIDEAVRVRDDKALHATPTQTKACEKEDMSSPSSVLVEPPQSPCVPFPSPQPTKKGEEGVLANSICSNNGIEESQMEVDGDIQGRACEMWQNKHAEKHPQIEGNSATNLASETLSVSPDSRETYSGAHSDCASSSKASASFYTPMTSARPRATQGEHRTCDDEVLFSTPSSPSPRREAKQDSSFAKDHELFSTPASSKKETTTRSTRDDAIHEEGVLDIEEPAAASIEKNRDLSSQPKREKPPIGPGRPIPTPASSLPPLPENTDTEVASPNTTEKTIGVHKIAATPLTSRGEMLRSTGMTPAHKLSPHDPRYRRLHNPDQRVPVQDRSFSSRIESALKRDAIRSKFRSNEQTAAVPPLCLDDHESPNAAA